MGHLATLYSRLEHAAQASEIETALGWHGRSYAIEQAVFHPVSRKVRSQRSERHRNESTIATGYRSEALISFGCSCFFQVAISS